MPGSPTYVHLTAEGSSLLARTLGGKPELLHWGPALGDRLPGPESLTGPRPGSSFDAVVPQHLVPEAAAGWLGTPGMRLGRGGAEVHAALTVVAVEQEHPSAATIRQWDAVTGVELTTDLAMEPDGLLRIRHTLRNTAETPLDVHQLFVTLPLPDRAEEILDTTGRWCREAHPQRHPVAFGRWGRPTRHGRTGHDAPLVFAAGTPGFGFRAGEVWNIHLAWSGNAEHYVEKLTSGVYVMGAGELLEQGDVVLGAGESYETPWLFASYSARGLDGNAAHFHAWDRRAHGPTTSRPVTLNSWEAVYMDHDLGALTALAEAGARVGVERFVLDDGWFLGRRDDTAGLGDWEADPTVWPGGLGSFIDRVHDLGMQFGLWVEPEMVNPDSELARAHPEWISRLGPGLPLSWRNQQVLDLTDEGAWDHLHGQLDRLLTDHAIDYLKWDDNRDSTEIGHRGVPRAHAQVLATYRLLDSLRTRHPHVEIENCSSGGGRIDLAITGRTDRTWGSDTNDPVERIPIQRWAAHLLPPERIGSHIGAPRAHTTGRVTDLGFRIGASWMQHLGIEWDIRGIGEADERALAEAIRLHKRYRGLLHTGLTVRGRGPDDGHVLQGVVAIDGGSAIYQYAALRTTTSDRPGRVQLPGLVAEAEYRVTPLMDAGRLSGDVVPPSWLTAGIRATGAFLGAVGLHMPLLLPQTMITVLAERVDS